MNEMKGDWDDLRLFLAVARGRGLAKAARATGKSAPTLSRRMLALERQMARDLFERLPRGYELTDHGHALFEQLERVEQSIQPLLAPKGGIPVVKISAGTWVSHLLMQQIDRIADTNVTLRFISADHPVDLLRREAVIGIRNTRPSQVGLAARRIGAVTFAVYATSPDVTVWARTMGVTPSARWVQQASLGAPAIEVSSPRNALDLALAGGARAVLPCFIGDNHHTLQRIGGCIDELTHTQWLVTHNEDRFLPSVRRVIDRVSDILRQDIGPGR